MFAPQSVPYEAARLLIIDDDAEFCRLHRRLLEIEGFSITTAGSGIEGIQKVRDSMPDMVLLDLQMSGMSGFEVLRVLRRAEQTKHLPVLCLTGAMDPAGLLRDASLGMAACGFLRKPFTWEELVAGIRRGLLREKDESSGESWQIYRCGPITVNLSRQEVWVDGKLLSISPGKQFALFCALLRRTKPASRTELLLEIWDSDHDINTVGMAVMRLREALTEAEGLAIESSPGGYRLIVNARH